MSLTRQQQELTIKPARDLIEEATQLLRRAPARVLLAYYVGTIPALLGVLYFFADMSRGAFAGGYLVEASLGVALLYLWMKCWQTVFVCGLYDCAAQEPARPWTAGRVARMIAVQCAIQPLGLFLRVIAFALMLPYVWVYGFFQSVGVLGDGQGAGLWEVTRKAWMQARLWPLQAAGGLALLKVFGFIVALNLTVAMVMAPGLLQTFFGIETVFSQSPMALLNTTVFAAVCGLTYLVFDPLRKGFYVVRCFHGAALHTGEDLRLLIKNRISAPVAAAVLLLAVCASSLANPVEPAKAPRAPAAAEVESAQLNDSLERVMNRREYAWRMPRVEAAEQDGFLAQTIKKIGKGFRDLMNGIGDAFERLRKALGGDKDKSSEAKNARSAGGSVEWVRVTLFVLAALLVVALVVLLLRFWRANRQPGPEALAVAPLPDLLSEQVDVRQLPEDGWLKLARELREAGELRLALRALYLAGLAHLGERDLITLARFKSNNDYQRELLRRARTRSELLAAFGHNQLAFESAWYGLHEVTHDSLGGFQLNLERIREC